MNRKNTFNRLCALCLAFILAAVASWAFTLPVKTVNGQAVYYYKVAKGESLYGVSRKLEVPVERIVQANPQAADGIRKGDILTFPCNAFPEISPDSKSLKKNKDILPPANPDPDGVLLGDFTTILPNEDADQNEQTERKNAVIGFILPFGLSDTNVEPSRRNTMALEFYKGVLIAADSLCNDLDDCHISIVARDCQGLSAAALRNMVRTDSLLSRADVIVAPDVDSLINVLPSATDAYVLNALNMRDSSYLYNPHMVQTNIPQRPMYAGAVDALLSNFADYQPVILRNTEGNNDREAFTTYLTERLAQKGVKPIVLEYKGNLLQSQLDALVSTTSKYVLIPSGGSVSEFNRFAYVLRNHNERAGASEGETGGTIALFGYPDWTAFRGEARDMLHTLGATIYSRFLDDPESYNSECLNNAFIHWYGIPQRESVPMYGTLGYDVCSFIIHNICENDGEFCPGDATPYTGIQSSFKLIKSERGYVNNALYIITYLPDGTTSARVR